MTQPELEAGGVRLTLSDLKKGKTPVHANEHERKAIQFCKRWLTGDGEFEFHTSGSTGSPKKITFKRSQLEASARLTEQALKLQPGYQALICLDTDFIAGAMMLVRSLVTGMNMIIKSPAANPLEEISSEINFVALVPYQVITVLEVAPEKLDKINTVIIGGAPLKEVVIESLQNLKPSFYATYGMTETIGHVALQKLNGKDQQDFFQLLPGFSALTDNRGCIVLTAPHLGTQPVITNDIVTLLGENRFRWMGRHDQVINSGGVKVLPEKIERVIDGVLAEMGIQKRFFVCGMPDQKLGEQVVLVLDGVKLNSDEEAAFKQNLARHLSKFETPKTFLYTPRFAETPTQKIDRAGTLKNLGYPSA